MRSAVLVFSLSFCACGLQRVGGRLLPDGGSIGTAKGCNTSYTEGNRVLDPPEASFANIQALRFDEAGNLYVLNVTNSGGWIDVFGPAPQHDFSRSLGKSAIVDGVDFVRAADGSFWVLELHDGPASFVAHVSAAGDLLTRFPVNSAEAGGIALTQAGKLLVGAGQIRRFEPDGTYLGKFGAKDPWPFYMNFAFDSRGRLWAAEMTWRTLDQFDEPTGDPLSSFGGHGTALGMFDGNTDIQAAPTKLAIDAQGNLYANDPLASRMLKFRSNGSPLGMFDFGGATNIYPIAVDPVAGNVYVGRGNGVDIICPL